MDFDQTDKNINGSGERSDKFLVTLTQFSLSHTNRLQNLGVPHLISIISAKDKILSGTYFSKKNKTKKHSLFFFIRSGGLHFLKVFYL